MLINSQDFMQPLWLHPSCRTLQDPSNSEPYTICSQLQILHGSPVAPVRAYDTSNKEES